MIASVLGEVGYPIDAVVELRDQVNALGERWDARRS